MKLLKIKLSNFQGIKALELNLEGKSASIYGDNATGKTTVYNALTWLLFDKASTGAKNFSPKTKGPEGDVHNLEHSAEGAFVTDDGQQITLKKTLHEVYKKKRGSATEEFSGHTVDYTVDGVPVKEKEYTTTVLELCGGDTEKTKMLTMPDYFPEQMPWDARRKILLEICGDVSDEDIIAANPDLTELTEFLGRYTIDEYRRVAAAQRKEINQKLTEIPARIDEATQAMPDTVSLNEDQIYTEITLLEKKRDQLLQEKADVATGDNASTMIRQQIAEVKIELAKAEAAHIKQEQEKDVTAKAAVATAQREEEKLKQQVLDMTEAIGKKRGQLSQMETLRRQLIEEYQAVNAEEWDAGSAVCPYCGQNLPHDQAEQLREDFYARKKERIAEINTRGKSEANKDHIAALKTEIESDTIELREIQARHHEMEMEVSRLTRSIPEPGLFAQFKATKEYYELNQKLTDLSARLEDAGGAAETARAAIETKIQAVNEAIQTERDKLLQLTEAKRRQQRIEELTRQEQELGAEFERLEKGLYLCDQFTKAKVAALTGRINSKFQRVRFRLFQEQLNGGLKEDCEVMIPTEDGRMVPYTFANNAARINAGLEIIGTLAEYWQVTMPVFIDNAESVTRLAEPEDMQIIRLVVSEADKELRMVI